MTDTMTFWLTTPLPPRTRRTISQTEQPQGAASSEVRLAERTGFSQDAQPSRAELVVKALIAEFLRPRNLDFF